MNRVRLACVSVVIALTVMSLVYASTQTRRPNVAQSGATKGQPQQISAEKTLATQQRLNKHFHSDVMPKLGRCWSGVQGKGFVEVEHQYAKSSDGRWVAGNLTVSRSDLPKGQDQAALRCLQDASRGTSFAGQADDNSTKYVARWTWPVPFPPNAAQLTTNMFAARAKATGGNDGGCDGRGTLAKCYSCTASGCVKVCVGYETCNRQDSGVCIAQDACASGGPFGVAGTAVIY